MLDFDRLGEATVVLFWGFFGSAVTTVVFRRVPLLLEATASQCDIRAACIDLWGLKSWQERQNLR
jgi:hypothetical protein